MFLAVTDLYDLGIAAIPPLLSLNTHSVRSSRQGLL